MNASQIKDEVYAAIRPAAAHNAPGRCGDTLIASLHTEIGTRFTRDEIEAALQALRAEGRVYLYQESRQSDLTAVDHLLAVRVGLQDRHWVQVL